MGSTSLCQVLMMVLTVCVWSGDGAVSNTPYWPTTGCTFTRHQEKFNTISVYQGTTSPNISQDTCERWCLREPRCGTYILRFTPRHCGLLQITPQLMENIMGIPEEAWILDNRFSNMGTKDCNAIISQTACSSYGVGQDRIYPKNINIVADFSKHPDVPADVTLTPAHCQAWCDVHDECVSVTYFSTSQGYLSCFLFNVTIRELIVTGREEDILTQNDTVGRPIWVTYDCVDIDECTRNTHNCDTNARCTDTPDGFTCRCYTGFTGDGFTCTVIPTPEPVTCPAPSECPVPPDCPATCFYIKSSVNTPTGSKFLGDLDPGDKVLTLSDEGGMRYEKVIMDIHRLPELETWFIKLQTQRNTIMVTPKHFLYAGKHPESTKLVTSDEILVGDYLLVNMNDSVGIEEVVKVEMVYDRGISTPVVASGRMLVNEILASVYVDDIQPLTPKSFHTIMWVMRMFNIYNIHIMDHEVEGMPAWAYYADRLREKFA